MESEFCEEETSALERRGESLCCDEESLFFIGGSYAKWRAKGTQWSEKVNKLNKRAARQF